MQYLMIWTGVVGVVVGLNLPKGVATRVRNDSEVSFQG